MMTDKCDVKIILSDGDGGRPFIEAMITRHLARQIEQLLDENNVFIEPRKNDESLNSINMIRHIGF
jgi:hypothetical protein